MQGFFVASQDNFEYSFNWLIIKWLGICNDLLIFSSSKFDIFLVLALYIPKFKLDDPVGDVEHDGPDFPMNSQRTSMH